MYALPRVSVLRAAPLKAPKAALPSRSRTLRGGARAHGGGSTLAFAHLKGWRPGTRSGLILGPEVAGWRCPSSRGGSSRAEGGALLYESARLARFAYVE